MEGPTDTPHDQPICVKSYCPLNERKTNEPKKKNQRSWSAKGNEEVIDETQTGKLGRMPEERHLKGCPANYGRAALTKTKRGKAERVAEDKEGKHQAQNRRRIRCRRRMRSRHETVGGGKVRRAGRK